MGQGFAIRVIRGTPYLFRLGIEYDVPRYRFWFSFPRIAVAPLGATRRIFIFFEELHLHLASANRLTRGLLWQVVSAAAGLRHRPAG